MKIWEKDTTVYTLADLDAMPKPQRLKTLNADSLLAGRYWEHVQQTGAGGWKPISYPGQVRAGKNQKETTS